MKANEKKVSMFVSHVTRKHHLLRYLWPFWSPKQLIQFLAGQAAIIAMMTLWLGHTPATILGVTAGVVLAGLCGRATRAMPSRLMISTRGAASDFLAELEALLLTQYHQRSDQATIPGCLHYSNSAPKWMHWGEQDVTVCVERHYIAVDGPSATLELLRHHIVGTKEA